MTLSRKTFSFGQSLLLIFLLAISGWAAGEVDTSFFASLTRTDFGRINAIAVQPDGKVLVGGFFRTVGSHGRSGFTRLNVDGTVDTGFLPPDFYNGSGTGGTISTIALLPDGKILVGGDFQGADGVAMQGVMRLNTDGSRDATFTSPLNNGGSVSDIVIAPDGDILIAGTFTINDGGGNRSGFARLNPNGNLDSLVYQNIAVSISKLLLLPDGRLIAGSSTNIRRFNADGTFDAVYVSVTTNGAVTDMHLLPDGKILVTGQFTQINGTNLRALLRLNVGGGVDTTFNVGGSNPNGSVLGLEPLPSGRFLIYGSFSIYNGVSRKLNALINADGALDVSYHFLSHSFNTINAMALLPDGKVMVGGPSVSGGLQPALTRTLPDGSPDSTFTTTIGDRGSAYAVAVQPDNKIIVVGQFQAAGGLPRASIARFNADGSIDSGFNPPGVSLSAGIYDIELQPDGKIIIPVWLGSSGFAYRLNPNGTLDRFFSSIPNSYDAEYMADGRFLLSHGDRVRRYTSDGSLDDSFASITNNSAIYEMAALPDGKVLIVGSFTTVGGQARGRIARLNSDGTLDTSFAPPGGANANINTILLLPDGKILVGGDFTGINFDTTKKYLARLNSDGSLDTSFSPVLNAPVLGLKRESNGKILIGGAFNVVNGAVRSGIARLNTDGSLDTGFNSGSGTNSTVWGVDQQSDGKIIYVGQFSRTNGISTPGIGRLLNASAPTSTLFDYDGDGKADVSVFRASENRWYIFRSSDSVVAQTAFAIAGDVPVPADYDGDLKTDVAIYRPSSGAWWYLSSLDGGQKFVQWGGEAGDIPRPSDFDGDGKTDFVIFRPANNFWYRISNTLTGTVSNVQFGLAGDKPVRGDFDGDGKSDVAIFRPSTGDWWYQSSINGAQLAVRWGISTDIPAPADFDGDGRTDFAVYRPSTGVWYVINSSNGSFLIGPFGTPEDKPVPADYDGDGKAELAVFRPSTGVWYQLRTNGGFFAMQFGVGTDTPTPNVFVP